MKWEETSIYFGWGISEAKITDFLSTSSMKRGVDSMIYLGVFLFIGVPRRC